MVHAGCVPLGLQSSQTFTAVNSTCEDQVDEVEDAFIAYLYEAVIDHSYDGDTECTAIAFLDWGWNDGKLLASHLQNFMDTDRIIQLERSTTTSIAPPKAAHHQYSISQMTRRLSLLQSVTKSPWNDLAYRT
jgi:hypothetical protein